MFACSRIGVLAFWRVRVGVDLMEMLAYNSTLNLPSSKVEPEAEEVPLWCLGVLASWCPGLLVS